MNTNICTYLALALFTLFMLALVMPHDHSPRKPSESMHPLPSYAGLALTVEAQHETGCYCDTCCYEGRVPVVNPDAPSYVE